MKTLKIILISIGSIIGLLLIISLFAPSSANVTREGTVAAPAENIFGLISDLKKWEEWTPWREMEPNAVYTYSEVTNAVGSWMSWEGDHSGHGKITITQITPNEVVKYDLEFLDHNMKFTGGISVAPVEEGNKVTWTNEGKLSWPLWRLMGLFSNFDNSMGEDFEKGLSKLKTVAEGLPVKKLPEITVSEVNVESKIVAGIRLKVSHDQIGDSIGAAFSEIFDFVAKKKNVVAPNTPVQCISHEWTESHYDMEPSVVLNKEIAGTDRIKIHKTYSGPTVKIQYMGSYYEMGPTYEAMYEWIKANGKSIAGPSWEVYITDPMAEPDTSKWLTEIYQPVR